MLCRALIILAALFLVSCGLRSTGTPTSTVLAPSAHPPPLSTTSPLPDTYPEPRATSTARSAAYPAPQATATPISAAYPAPQATATPASAAYPAPQASATSVAAQPTALPTATLASSAPQPTAAPTIEMTSTPRPTPTTPPTPAVSPTLTWTAPPLPESGFWDDFDGAVGENWKWYYPDEDYVSLELAPGKLRIYPQSGGLPSGNPRNLLLANAPQDDYEISTFLAFTPESNYQFAGLLILNDLNNALQFGVGYAECTDPLNCLGRALYFTSFQDGAPSEQTIATLANDTDQIYLRLQRQGKNYRAEYSLDGLEWLQAGVLTNPLTPNWVGLTAGQSESGYNPEIFADFDYFSLSLLP